jgi:hypothetical protein
MKLLTKTLYIISIIVALPTITSCKKVTRSFGSTVSEKATKEIGQEASKSLSEKTLRKMDWDDVVDYVKKENSPLSESLEELDKKTRKMLLNAFHDDVRFFNSLLTPQYNLVNDYKIFTKNAPKLANDINFLKMFAKSKYEAKRFGAVDLFDNIVIKEQNGFVLFLRKEGQQEIARYRYGIIELSNSLIKGSKISESSLLRYQLLPNSTYKVRGKDGLLYLFNIDNFGRVSSVKANYISPNDISTNVFNRNFDIYLGNEWDSSLKQLRQASKGNDVELNVVYKYADNSNTPKYAIIEANIRGKKQFKKTFENIDKSSGRRFTVASNNEILRINGKTCQLSAEQEAKLLEEMNADEGLAKLIHEDPLFNIERWKTTRNHVDESFIVLTSKGRVPPNARTYAGNVYYFNPHLNPALKARLERGKQFVSLKKEIGLTYDDLIKLDKMYPNGVPFSKEGYPDFTKVAFKDKNGNPMRVNIGKLSGDSKKDIERAETMFRQQGYEWRDGFTWHHEENSTILLRVPTIIHQLVDHAGGMSTTPSI